MDMVMVCGGLGSILGGNQYGGQGVYFERTYDFLAMPHDMLRIDLDFIALDTWDGETATVTLDGEELWAWSGGTGGGPNQCGRGSPELVHHISVEIEHTGNTGILRVTTMLDQTAEDESFAIDNVQLIPVQTSFTCTSDRVLCQRGIFDNFESGIDEWTSNVELSTTGQCGGLSSILGGFGVLGQGAWLEKTYDLAAYPHDELSLSLDFIKIDSWDNEEARVLIDGVVVWSQVFIYNEGSDFGGNGNYAEWLDEKLKVGPFEMPHDTDTLTLRVETTLNEDPNNESFGIDNVRLILQMLGYLDRFERSADYWSFADGSPARPSECGSFGSILGG